MPFQKGNKLAVGAGGGRPSADMEEREYEIMGARFRGAMSLAEKIEKGTATPNEIKRFQTLLPMVNKFCDKRHTNKNSVEVKGGLSVYNWGETKPNET
jgi:hypothetical protein